LSQRKPEKIKGRIGKDKTRKQAAIANYIQKIL